MGCVIKTIQFGFFKAVLYWYLAKSLLLRALLSKMTELGCDLGLPSVICSLCNRFLFPRWLDEGTLFQGLYLGKKRESARHAFPLPFPSICFWKSSILDQSTRLWPRFLIPWYRHSGPPSITFWFPGVWSQWARQPRTGSHGTFHDSWLTLWQWLT